MLLTVGFPISYKENEKRRALDPMHLSLLKHPEYIYIEQGYGEVLGYNDDIYRKHKINVVSREEVLTKDIICDPKIGDAEYLNNLNNQIIFGWIHAVQNRNITDSIISNNLSGYAWEDMYEDGRHSFWRNNEIAGEAAIVHAYMCHGIFPYHTKVAILGRGNIARGALRTLNYMGADITTYDRKTEDLFKKELANFDVIVNAILWDTNRKDHIIYKTDLKRMKKNALIIDISCDSNGGIETSMPTSIENPIYTIDNIVHYVVDHTPSLFWKIASESISSVVVDYIDMLIENRPNDVLLKAQNFKYGKILDSRINLFQNR